MTPSSQELGSPANPGRFTSTMTTSRNRLAAMVAFQAEYEGSVPCTRPKQILAADAMRYDRPVVASSCYRAWSRVLANSGVGDGSDITDVHKPNFEPGDRSRHHAA